MLVVHLLCNWAIITDGASVYYRRRDACATIAISMFKHKKQKNVALLAFALAFVLWGINTVYIKIAVSEIPPMFYYFIRFAVPALVLAPFVIRGRKKIKLHLWSLLVLSTIVGFVVPNLLLAEGLRRTSAIDTSLIFLLGPVFMFVLSIEFLKERFNARILLGLVTSFCGALLIVVGPLLNTSLAPTGDFTGNVLILLSMLTATIGIIMIKPVLKKVPPMQVTGLRFAIASIATAPLVIISKPDVAAISWSPQIVFALAYGIIFGSIIAYVLYHVGLKRISGEESSTLQYLDPLAGVLSAIFILGEQVTPIVLLGGLLTVWGVYLSEVKSKHHHVHLRMHR